ncbi:MAG: FlgD immunoglobulin-like domain containing protein, partial [Elusimicrobiota bacterium]
NVDLVGAWSSIVSSGVYVSTVSPSAPELESPLDGETREEYSPEFNWNKSSGHGIKYVLQLSDADENFNVIYSSYGYKINYEDKGEWITATDFSTSIDRNKYWWRVRAVDGARNKSPWSSTRSFISNRIPQLDWTDELVDTGVTPQVGSAKSTFTYEVEYKDDDGVDPGGNIVLHVNSSGKTGAENWKEYDLSGDGADIQNGRVYSSTCSLTFDYDDNPKYYFTAFDGLSWATGKPTGTYTGPIIDNPVSFTTDQVDSEKESSGSLIKLWVNIVAPEGVKLDTSTVKYSIYHDSEKVSGGSNVKLEDINEDSTEAVFSVTTDTFKTSVKNYIRWSCEDSTGERWESSMTRVEIQTNESPFIKIVQPANEGYSTLNPVIEADITDEIGIDKDSIKVQIFTMQNDQILSVSGEDKPDIYNSDTRRLKYVSSNLNLEDNTDYKLKISATDTGYSEEESESDTAEITFTARNQPIADLIPYPSPFDPEKESAKLRYVLADDGRVTLNIYDTSRELVKSVVEDVERDKGQNEETWDGSNLSGNSLANGIYYVELIVEMDKEYRRYQRIAIFRN